MAAYEVLLLNTAIPQIQAAQAGDTYVVPRDIAFSTVASLAAGTEALPSLVATGDVNTGFWFPAADTIAASTGGTRRLTIDASGNLGLGVTPSAWATSGTIFKALQIGAAGSVSAGTVDASIHTSQNAYFDGTSWRYIQAATAGNYYINGNSHVWRIAPSGTAGDPITFTQAMTLDASGNLGVGTTSPQNDSGYGGFTVNGTNGSIITLRAGSANSGRIYTTTVDQINIDANGTASGTILFRTGTSSTERARITSGGDFVVSSTGTPLTTGTKLTVNGSHTDWMAGITNTNASPRGLFIGHNTDSNGTANWFLYCEAGGSTQRMSVRSNGGIANYQSNNADLSDIRTKTDIKPLESYWSKIAGIEIVSYKYKDQTHDDLNIGVIAQQVEQVAPEFIDIDGFSERIPEDGVPLKAVYNKDLTFAAIKALQEAMARIETLEAKIAALEAK